MRPHVYTKHGWTREVDVGRCRAAVHDGGRGSGFHQCLRKTGLRSWTDPDTCVAYMFCTGGNGHHPDEVERRRQESSVRWHAQAKAERDRDVAFGLRGATDAELQAEYERRGLFPGRDGRWVRP